MSDKILNEIHELLEDIKAINLLANSSKIEDSKKQILREDSEQHKIYELCDGKTTKEIADRIQKSTDYVSSNLSQLRRKGLIKTIDKEGKKIHEQRF